MWNNEIHRLCVFTHTKKENLQENGFFKTKVCLNVLQLYSNTTLIKELDECSIIWY